MNSNTMSSVYRITGMLHPSYSQSNLFRCTFADSGDKGPT